MPTFRDYEICIPDEELEHLQRKLELTNLPKAVPGSNGTSWDQGPPLKEIQRLVHAWRTTYNWRQVEARLNLLPNFMAKVDTDDFGTLNVHFIHKRSPDPAAIPLLFLHGWPGCFLEATKMLDGLVRIGDSEATFHVVAPSLIDFGFSAPSPVGKSFSQTSIWKLTIAN